MVDEVPWSLQLGAEALKDFVFSIPHQVIVHGLFEFMMQFLLGNIFILRRLSMS